MFNTNYSARNITEWLAWIFYFWLMVWKLLLLNLKSYDFGVGEKRVNVVASKTLDIYFNQVIKFSNN